MIAAGKKLFGGKGICFTCHGDNAKGAALAPDLTDDKWLQIQHDYKQIATLIRTGVPHPKEHPTPMPPMGGAQLSDEEICALASYVYSIGK
jgi:mono/diheme cytochrome c family protein